MNNLMNNIKKCNNLVKVKLRTTDEEISIIDIKNNCKCINNIKYKLIYCENYTDFKQLNERNLILTSGYE